MRRGMKRPPPGPPGPQGELPMPSTGSAVAPLLTALLAACAASYACAEPVFALLGSSPHNAFTSAADDLGVRIETSGDPSPEKVDALLVCAPEYPRVESPSTSLRETIESFLSAGKSVYVEYTPLAGLLAGQPRTAGFERIFVSAQGRATEGLHVGDILEEHASSYLPADGGALSAEGARVLLSYGRAAGLDRAVFGPPDDSLPALLEVPRGNGRLLVATTALSNCVKGRYRPARSWQVLLRSVLLSLLPPETALGTRERYIELEAWTEPRQWIPTGRPVRLHVKARADDDVTATGPDGEIDLTVRNDGALVSRPLRLTQGRHELRVTVTRGEAKRECVVEIEVSSRSARYEKALARNLRWFEQAGMLIAPDGSAGVREGLTSSVGADGRPATAGGLRVDCISECALAFHLYGRMTGKRLWLDRGRRMLSYVAEAFQVDTKDSWYFGHWQSRGEYRDEGSTVYVFSDDSGAATLFSLLGFAASGNEALLQAGLRGVEYFCHVASEQTGLPGSMPYRNYHGSGPMGVPWPTLRGQKPTSGAPHVMNLPLAGLLAAHRITGEERYLTIARRAIRTIMAGYPDWPIVTSRTCEHTRMLLPLAFLYQIEPSTEHRQWLDTALDYLIGKQDRCGALAEWDGRNPDSNAAFGTAETSVFQSNGDPISDQLYNTGFALLHLWLAYQATGEPRVRRAFERLGDYLTRIQIDDPDPRYDGTWLRAFDYSRWEYFGSSADVGWGPYCSETGWMCAPLDLGMLLFLAYTLGDSTDCPETLLPATPDRRLLSSVEEARREADQVETALSVPPRPVTGLRALPSRGPYAALQWDAPEGTLWTYRVHRSDLAQFTPGEGSLVGATDSGQWVDEGLSPDTEYYYRVATVNGLGQTAAPTEALKVTTGPPSKALGRLYTKSIAPHPGYGDTDDSESTDGVRAGAYGDGKSYGYRLSDVGASVSLDITLDLGADQAIARVSHHNCGAPGYRPDEIRVAVSRDGEAWTDVGATTQVIGDVMIVDFPETTARFVRIGFTKQRHGATDDWLFVGELEVF